MRRFGFLVFSFFLIGILEAAAASPSESAMPPSLSWFKGNTHTHTLNSDGDSTPSIVARWYRDHDYDFLVLSDHNFRTEIAELQEEIAEENAQQSRKPFLLIYGEEVSDRFDEPGRVIPIHVNGLGTTRVVGKQGGDSVQNILQRNIDAIHDAGGLPHVNHPNYQWALTADDLASLERIEHFEIFNGHPFVRNLGDDTHPSLEAMWDNLLSRGYFLYGVATDDAHHFQTWADNKANPGRGWICVRAAELTPEAILTAIREGNHYCSTGVELSNIAYNDGVFRIEIQPKESETYRTEFIGKNGTVLLVDETLTPQYTVKPDDLYVRVRVADGSGHFAWTQPVLPSRGSFLLGK